MRAVKLIIDGKCIVWMWRLRDNKDSGNVYGSIDISASYSPE